jgi:hypothetical protein
MPSRLLSTPFSLASLSLLSRFSLLSSVSAFPGPCPRRSALMAAKGSALFLYGGIVEATRDLKEKECTLNDFYALDVGKSGAVPHWRVLFEVETAWVGEDDPEEEDDEEEGSGSGSESSEHETKEDVDSEEETEVRGAVCTRC